MPIQEPPVPSPSAAATASKNDSIASTPPPPIIIMAHHTANEFSFANRTLLKMVLHSEFFPMRAAFDDWFVVCPRDRDDDHDDMVVANKKNNNSNNNNNNNKHHTTQSQLSSSSHSSQSWTPEQKQQQAVEEHMRRRPSLESTDTASTTSSVTSSNSSPIMVATRRHTAAVDDCIMDIDSMMMASAMDNKLSLPLMSFDSNSTHDDNADTTAANTDTIKSNVVGVDSVQVQASRRASEDNAHLLKIKAPTSKSEVSEQEANVNVNVTVNNDVQQYHSTVPAVHEKDIDYDHGAILGKGGFCEVRLVTLKKTDNKKQKQKNSKEALLSTSILSSNNSTRQQYAMKYLSPTETTPKDNDNNDGKNKKPTTTPTRDKQFERGIADLAIEARFLTLLSHENIIRVHYISDGTLTEQFNCKDEVEGDDYCHQFGYFLLLDPLVETLAKRIEGSYIPSVFNNNGGTTSSTTDNETTVVPVPSSSSSRGGNSSWWKRMMEHNKSTTNSKNSNKNIQLESWKAGLAERLQGLKGIASALQYLHDDCRVIYRDVKPDNIGFYRKLHPQCHCGKRRCSHSNKQAVDGCTCYTDIPQLFDFGLAKELKPKYLQPHHHNPSAGEVEVNTYKLTARSGSRRYMAPEVAFAHPYNEKADVYSFGIVLYQVASLIMPFDGYSLHQHEQEVLNCGGRPNVTIPSTRKTLFKIKNKSNHDQWQRMKDDKKRIKHLEYRTKCVWTKNLKLLLEECWHADMRCRPSMRNVVERLDTCICELTSNHQTNNHSDVHVATTTQSLQDKKVVRKNLQDEKVVRKSIGCVSTKISDTSVADGRVAAQ